MNTWTYLTNRKLTNFWCLDPGIIESRWKKDSNQSLSRTTALPPKNKSKWKNFSSKTWKKDISDHLNLQWPLHSFCRQKGWKAPTHSRLLLSEQIDNQKCISPPINLWHHWQTPKFLILYQNLISSGVTTMFKSKKAANGRLHSKPIKDFLNQQ